MIAHPAGDRGCVVGAAATGGVDQKHVLRPRRLAKTDQDVGVWVGYPGVAEDDGDRAAPGEVDGERPAGEPMTECE